jgi:hypothetical protein
MNTDTQTEIKIEPWMSATAQAIHKVLEDYSKHQPTADEMAEMIADRAPRFVLETLPDVAGTGRVHCPVCQRPLNLTMGHTIPLNTAKVSMLVVVHKPSRCECGREYVPFITGGNLQCAIAEMQPESSIITLPPGAKLHA